jgi:hypothetical protein
LIWTEWRRGKISDPDEDGSCENSIAKRAKPIFTNCEDGGSMDL